VCRGICKNRFWCSVANSSSSVEFTDFTVEGVYTSIQQGRKRTSEQHPRGKGGGGGGEMKGFCRSTLMAKTAGGEA
jgi:hypothetical protein